MRNLLLTAALAAIVLFTAANEGYLHTISVLFWLVLMAGVAMTACLGRVATTTRMLALILVVYLIETVKEANGIRDGLWIYHGRGGLFSFGVWSWVVGAVGVSTVAVRWFAPWIRGILGARYGAASPQIPAWVAPALVLLLFLLMAATLGPYRPGVGRLFWIFYLILAAVCLYAVRKMDFALFAALAVTSIFIGNVSEFVGGVQSGIWTFPHDRHWPPFFLVCCCWPLEIIAQYAIAAYFADEPLDLNKP
jgi:hypothetical protein